MVFLPREHYNEHRGRDSTQQKLVPTQTWHRVPGTLTFPNKPTPYSRISYLHVMFVGIFRGHQSFVGMMLEPVWGRPVSLSTLYISGTSRALVEREHHELQVPDRLV